MLGSISAMLTRPNLPMNARFGLITCLANLSFDSSMDQHLLNTCNHIFMNEFLANCTTKDDTLSKIMNQCLRGLNKSLPHLRDVIQS
jgi:hypothetical protein